MNSDVNKTKSVRIHSLLRNVAVLFGVAAAFLLLLGLMPSAKKSAYLIWALLCGAACAGLLYAAVSFGKKYRVMGIGVGGKPSFREYVALIFAALLILIPFYMLVITSVKKLAEANDAAFTWWPKMGFQFDSLREVFNDDTTGITILASFFNSLKYSLPTTIVCVFVSALSAFSFAKLYFPGKNKLFGFMLFTIMVPGCATMTSSYLMFNAMNLTGTPWPFILPGLFGSVTVMFFLKEFFSGIPDSVLEAAKIDGAGKSVIFFRIVLPLGMPAIIAQCILDFITRYNDYISPLIYLNWPEDYTLQLALSKFNGFSSVDNSKLAAACVISIAPLLAIYLACSDMILKGIALSSGLKD